MEAHFRAEHLYEKLAPVSRAGVEEARINVYRKRLPFPNSRRIDPLIVDRMENRWKEFRIVGRWTTSRETAVQLANYSITENCRRSIEKRYAFQGTFVGSTKIPVSFRSTASLFSYCVTGTMNRRMRRLFSLVARETIGAIPLKEGFSG